MGLLAHRTYPSTSHLYIDHPHLGHLSTPTTYSTVRTFIVSIPWTKEVDICVARYITINIH